MRQSRYREGCNTYLQVLIYYIYLCIYIYIEMTTMWFSDCILLGIRYLKYCDCIALGIQSPSANGSGTEILCVSEVIGSLGFVS